MSSSDFCRCPDCTKAREQQRELDAWIASVEQTSEPGADSYNAASAAAAEAIRQGNWSWEQYQEWKAKQPVAEEID